MPHQDQFVYAFAEYFASRLNSELLPIGFVMNFELVMYDITANKSIDGFGRKIPHTLWGQSSQVYVIFRTMVWDNIMKIVLPEDFYNKVKEDMDEIRRRM